MASPYETRTWSQFWYPIQQIGPAKNANRFAAINVEPMDGKLKVGVCVTELLQKQSSSSRVVEHCLRRCL